MLVFSKNYGYREAKVAVQEYYVRYVAVWDNDGVITVKLYNHKQYKNDVCEAHRDYTWTLNVDTNKKRAVVRKPSFENEKNAKGYRFYNLTNCRSTTVISATCRAEGFAQALIDVSDHFGIYNGFAYCDELLALIGCLYYPQYKSAVYTYARHSWTIESIKDVFNNFDYFTECMLKEHGVSMDMLDTWMKRHFYDINLDVVSCLDLLNIENIDLLHRAVTNHRFNSYTEVAVYHIIEERRGEKVAIEYFMNPQFKEYCNCLSRILSIAPEFLNDKVLEGGFTKSYKMLQEIERCCKLKDNMPCESFKEQAEPDATINGYTFHTANTVDELVKVGTELQICVGNGGYNRACAEGWLKIIYVTYGDEYVACIEVHDNWVVQQIKGYRNSLPDEIGLLEALHSYFTASHFQYEDCCDYTNMLGGISSNLDYINYNQINYEELAYVRRMYAYYKALAEEKPWKGPTNQLPNRHVDHVHNAFASFYFTDEEDDEDDLPFLY